MSQSKYRKTAVATAAAKHPILLPAKITYLNPAYSIEEATEEWIERYAEQVLNDTLNVRSTVSLTMLTANSIRDLSEVFDDLQETVLEAVAALKELRIRKLNAIGTRRRDSPA